MYLAPPLLFPARWKVIHSAEEWGPGNETRLYIVLLSCYMQTILLGDFGCLHVKCILSQTFGHWNAGQSTKPYLNTKLEVCIKVFELLE